MYNNIDQTISITPVGPEDVDHLIEAQTAIDQIKRGRFIGIDLLGEPAYEKSVAPVRRVGEPILKKFQQEALKTTILANTPIQKSLSHRAWTVDAVRDLIAKDFGKVVSLSTARNYIKKFELDAPKPLNRRKATLGNNQKDWLKEQFTVLNKRAKAASQKIIWITSRFVGEGDVAGKRLAIHAVANTTGKASWLVLPNNNRLGMLAELLDSFGAGNGETPLVLFDDSICDTMKGEIQGFLAIKHGNRKDGGGKTKKERATAVNTQSWLSTIFEGKADFFHVGTFELGVDCKKTDVKGLAEQKRLNHEFLASSPNMNQWLAKKIFQTAINEVRCNKGTSSVFLNAIEWVIHEGTEPQSFEWCLAMQECFDPDHFRHQLLVEIAGSKKSDPEKREIAHFLLNDYQ